MESTVASLQACPQCGALNRPRLQFCLSCGGRLWTPPPPAPVAEKRPLTVLEKIEAAKKEVESALGPLTISPSTAQAERAAYMPRPASRKSRAGLWTGVAVVLVMVLVGVWLFSQYDTQGRQAAVPVPAPTPIAETEQTTPIRAVPPPPAVILQNPAASATASDGSLADVVGATAEQEVEIPRLPMPTDLSEPPTAPAVKKDAPARKAPARNAARPSKNEPPAAVQAPAPLPEPTPVAAVPAPPPTPTLAQRVAQCRQLSLFQRESCLWDLCNGNWGKDGCPSYRSQQREP